LPLRGPLWARKGAPAKPNPNREIEQLFLKAGNVKKRKVPKMEPKKFQLFIVKENSPAFEVIKKHFNQKRSIKSGKIIPVSDDEFKSFQDDFMLLEIERKNSDSRA
jgi:hypothetical protein